MINNWEKAQKWEKDWWGNCVNTFGEETKQLLYANRMGLVQIPNASTPFRFDLGGISVLDIGGGPVSLLLKCENVKGMVLEPLTFPAWIKARYKAAGIDFAVGKGEQADGLMNGFDKFDEVWIYNVLQHCENPQKVIQNVRKVGKVIRLFEWIDTPTNEGHPHALTEKELNKWLKGEGKVEELKGQNTCFGKCYYGVFPTKRS